MAFLPEVCTAAQFPTNATNQLTGLAWASPGSAIVASSGGYGGAYASGINGSPTQRLRLAPLAAGNFTSVLDGARITKVTLSYDSYGIYSGNAPTWRAYVSVDNTPRSSNLSLVATTSGTYAARTPVTWNRVAQSMAITGAELKNNLVGVSIWNDGLGFNGDVYIRNCKLIICYENPAAPESAALQMCEA